VLVANVFARAKVDARALVRELTGVLLLLDEEGNKVVHVCSDAIAAGSDSEVEDHVEGAESASAGQ